MCNTERRRRFDVHPRRLESDLTLEQVLTLREIEHFGWELKVVRHPLFQPPVAIVFDGTRTCYGVIEADGSFNEHPSIEIRHDAPGAKAGHAGGRGAEDGIAAPGAA